MNQTYVTRFRAMGSQFQVWLDTTEDGAAVLSEVPAWVEELEARLSRFRATSELSRLNDHGGEWVAVSDELLDAILVALSAARLTHGLVTPLILPALIAAGYDRSFDDLGARPASPASDQPSTSSVPDWSDIQVEVAAHRVRLPAGAQIDLGGVGKGWTAERIADRLEKYGSCLVDAGGDLVARGKPQTGSGWRVGVAEPGANSEDILLQVSLHDCAVATSGTDYRRWENHGLMQHHIIDPRTGRPAETDVLMATVIDIDAERAEAYAKLLILLGSTDGLRWFAEHGTGSALVVRHDRAVLATESFQTYLV